jgi:predicted metalloprotease with PDZ domain
MIATVHSLDRIVSRVGIVLVAALAVAPGAGEAGSAAPTAVERAPTIGYTVSVDTADLGSIRVTMRLGGVRDTVRLAMATHPEYDDRYWRYVRDVRVEGLEGTARVVREDSAVWRAVVAGGTATVHYRVALPPPGGALRGSWKPFLRATGGLVGGPDTFLYVVGVTRVPVRLRLELPAGWQVATGLAATGTPRDYVAPSVDALLDSPVLLGGLRAWSFMAAGRQHEVAYWPIPDAVASDTMALVRSIEAIVTAATSMMGPPPYARYAFLLQDGAGGALEHRNSLTLGMGSRTLAADPIAFSDVIAHEFVHTWNLVWLRPAGREGGVSHEPPPRTNGLWWSEGVTIHFADVVRRRIASAQWATMPGGSKERARLVATHRGHELGREASLIGRYLGNPGNTHVSPERASWASADPPTMRGDYGADYYTQGELVGEVLDLIVRDSTGGRHGVEDITRALYTERAGGAHSPEETRGFRTGDIERVAGRVCGCNLRGFFAAHVRAAKALDLAGAFRTIGLRLTLARVPATDSAGRLLPDRRVYAYPYQAPDQPDSSPVQLVIEVPGNAWARAGLRTGDSLIALDQRPVASGADFRTALAGLGVGDSVRVTVRRAGVDRTVTVRASGYEKVNARLEEDPRATREQRARREAWLAGRW